MHITVSINVRVWRIYVRYMGRGGMLQQAHTHMRIGWDICICVCVGDIHINYLYYIRCVVVEIYTRYKYIASVWALCLLLYAIQINMHCRSGNVTNKHCCYR